MSWTLPCEHSCTDWLWWFLQGTGALLCFHLAAGEGMLEHRTVLLYLGASPRWQGPARILLWEADRKVGVKNLKLKWGDKLKIENREECEHRIDKPVLQTLLSLGTAAGFPHSRTSCLPSCLCGKAFSPLLHLELVCVTGQLMYWTRRRLAKIAYCCECLLGLWGNKTRSLLQ